MRTRDRGHSCWRVHYLLPRQIVSRRCRLTGAIELSCRKLRPTPCVRPGGYIPRRCDSEADASLTMPSDSPSLKKADSFDIEHHEHAPDLNKNLNARYVTRRDPA